MTNYQDIMKQYDEILKDSLELLEKIESLRMDFFADGDEFKEQKDYHINYKTITNSEEIIAKELKKISKTKYNYLFQEFSRD